MQTNAVTNSWTAYLFNHTTGAWDALFTSANTSKLTETHGGWDMFEVYTEYNPATGDGHYCGETNGSTWAATNIQIRFGTTWQSLATANSQIHPSPVASADFGCENLAFTVTTPNSGWRNPLTRHAPRNMGAALPGTTCPPTSARRSLAWTANEEERDDTG